MNYNFYSNTQSPQTTFDPNSPQPQVRGGSGAVAFKVSPWTLVQRGLLLGTCENSYYNTKFQQTDMLVAALQECAKEDPKKLAEKIVKNSHQTLSLSANLFALAILSKHATKEFREIFPQVVRNMSQFYEWLGYTKATRGMGNAIIRAGKDWIESRSPKDFAYQVLKYQSRYGFSATDVLRMFHPKQPTLDPICRFILREEVPAGIELDDELQQLHWFIQAKRDPSIRASAIRAGRLTWEMVNHLGEMDRSMWEALQETMPAHALLRNLAALTRHSALDVARVKSVFSPASLRPLRIHPLQIIKSLQQYETGGSSGKSKGGEYTPNMEVCRYLGEVAFAAMRIPGDPVPHVINWIDCSGSMDARINGTQLACKTAAFIMAFAMRNPIECFDTKYIQVGRANYLKCVDVFSTARVVEHIGGGGTDCSIPFTSTKQLWDAGITETQGVIVYTDSESFAGHITVDKAIQELRQVIPECRIVFVSLAVNELTHTRKCDRLSLDVSGFEPELPKIINMFFSGELD